MILNHSQCTLSRLLLMPAYPSLPPSGLCYPVPITYFHSYSTFAPNSTPAPSPTPTPTPPQAHVVSAFEQSLHNMTSRLQALTVTAETKVTKLL